MAYATLPFLPFVLSVHKDLVEISPAFHLGTEYTIQKRNPLTCRSQNPMEEISILVSPLNSTEAKHLSVCLQAAGPSIMAEGWTLYTLAAVVVGLRVFAQLKFTRQFGVGDIVMIAALVSKCAQKFVRLTRRLTFGGKKKTSGFLQLTVQTIAYSRGWGRHFYYLDDSQRVNAMETVFVSEPFGNYLEPNALSYLQPWWSSINVVMLAIMCSTLGRVSFMILMLRLFGTTKARRWLLYFLIGEQLVVNLFTCITIFTQCGNVLSLWDPIGHPSKCWSPDVQTDTGYVQGGKHLLQMLGRGFKF